MSKIKLFQIDAFAEKVFEGNPAGVCVLEEWLADVTMQQIAAENNLAETAFAVKEPEGWRIRWFTPTVEVDLCGHATLATAFVLFQQELVQGSQISFQSRSSLLKIQKLEEGLLELDFPADMPQKAQAPNHLLEGLGIEKGGVLKGITDFVVILSSEEAVKALSPDFKTLAKVKARGVIVTAKGENKDFISRFFGPQSGIDEDPVTGSAHTTLTPLWADRLGKETLTARQISPRGGNLLCKLVGGRVRISGKAVQYLEGEIEIA